MVYESLNPGVAGSNTENYADILREQSMATRRRSRSKIKMPIEPSKDGID